MDTFFNKFSRLAARCILLIGLTFTCSAIAGAVTFEVDGLYYQTTGSNTVMVIKQNYSSLSGEVIIPENVVYNQTTYTVTMIDWAAFDYNNTISSIIIPSSVREIGASAFSCSNIESVTIPNGVIKISSSVFAYCHKLETIAIPNSVKEIGYSAFEGCHNLKSVSLPNALTTLESSLFRGCNSLEEVNLPKQVKSIKRRAFYDCSSLKSIALPDSLRIIGGDAFRGCSSFSSVTIPQSVDSICNGAFYGCSSLIDIDFPDKIIWIGPEAFYATPWLANQPEGLLYFGVTAYTYLGSMPDGSTVSIKPGTKYIASNCFSNCTWMSAVDIPESVTQIGSSAFSGCSGLAAIDIPESVTQIESSAFSGCSGLADITLPQAITKISSNTFYGCTSLTSIRIPDQVTTIEEEAFAECGGLKQISLPNSLKTVGYSAFSKCLSLETIDLPQGITRLGSGAFQYCTNLKSVTLPTHIESIYLSTFSDCTNLTDVLLPSNLISIGDYAFYNCSKLGAIQLPRTLQSISDYAFAKCSSLSSIKLPASLLSLGYDVFQGCDALHQVMSLAMSPPTAHEDEDGWQGQWYEVYPGTFNGIDKDNCVLHVFESAMNDYKKAKGWRLFTQYELLDESVDVPGDVNGDGVVDIADVNGIVNDILGKAAIVFDLDGAQLGLQLVQGGTFEMGLEDGIPVEDFYDYVPTPQHQVTLNSYLISTTEVTQQFFHAVMGGTEPEYDQMKCPIYGINLNRVNTFLQRLNAVTGLNFRLPTEAEWEFAARGGIMSQGYRYSGSNNASDVGWCTYTPWGPSVDKEPHPVGSRQPNELGIYDMSGNVWEWCNDWFADYTEDPQINPTGPETGTMRVIRGGSCYNDGRETRCDVYSRAAAEPLKTTYGTNNEPIGFRLALDLNNGIYNKACDINSDGMVDIADINLAIDVMIGKRINNSSAPRK